MTDWWESLVQIDRSDGDKGSGIFITPSIVLTAAHVVTSGGSALDPAELEVFVRFQSRSVRPGEVSVLPRWQIDQPPQSDIALLHVPSSPGLGVRVAFGLPPASASAMLEAAGFEGEGDEFTHLAGRARCEATTAGDLFLFSEDISPIPGMSGGPVYAGTPHGVRVTGVITQVSSFKFFGLSVASDVLAALGFVA